MGECLCHIGRAMRFGLDTPGQDGVIEREGLAKELGDVGSATRFAAFHKVVDGAVIQRTEAAKTIKLHDRRSLDNLGRPLTPAPAEFQETHAE
jgi:hypothetical protein